MVSSPLNMKLSRKLIFPAIAFVALGVLIAAASWTFAPVCEVPTDEHPTGLFVVTKANKTLPMPCGYTARAEIGVGAVIIGVGAMMLFAASAPVIAILGALGIGLGGLTIAMPTALTKTCALADHTCNTMTLPTLTLLGIGLIAVSVGLVFYRNRLKLQ